MSKRLKLILWIILYGGMIYISYQQIRVEFFQNEVLDLGDFLALTLFDVQKLFFDVAGFLIVFLFIVRRPLTSQMVVVRCQETYFSYLMKYVWKCWGFFCSCTVVLYFGIAFLGGSALNFDGTFLWDIVGFFSVVFVMCLVYLVIFLRTNHQIFGMTGILIVNMIFLTPALFGSGVEEMLLYYYLILGVISLIVIFVQTIYKAESRD